MRKLYVALFVITLLNGGLFLTKEASAREKVVYMAGNFQEGTFICHCPIIQGDCMCAIHTD